VADHGGVGEQEQRFSDQRTERGYREAQDLAIDGAAVEDVDGPSLAMAVDCDGRGRGLMARPPKP